MKSDTNIFWVAFQSNVLADLANVSDDFTQKMDSMKKNLEKQNFTLPCLQYNMRNTKQISNVTVDAEGYQHMQEAIKKLKCGNSSVVGNIPTWLKVRYENDWDKQKKEILKHSIDLIKKNNYKNIVVLFNDVFMSKGIKMALENVLQYQTILTYPSDEGKEKGTQNVKDFCEKPNHVLLTPFNYFNGCEAANVIYIGTATLADGVRNEMLRGVENFVYIQIGGEQKVHGMKEDNTFYPYEKYPYNLN